MPHPVRSTGPRRPRARSIDRARDAARSSVNGTAGPVGRGIMGGPPSSTSTDYPATRDTPRRCAWIGLDWIGLDGTGLGVPRQPGPHGGNPTHSSAGNGHGHGHGHGNRETSSARRRVHGTNSSAGRPGTPRTQRTQKEDRSKDVESRIASTQPPCDAGMQVVVSAAHQGSRRGGSWPWRACTHNFAEDPIPYHLFVMGCGHVDGRGQRPSCLHDATAYPKSCSP